MVLQCLSNSPIFRLGVAELARQGVLKSLKESFEQAESKKQRSRLLLKRRSTIECRELIEKKPAILARRARGNVAAPEKQEPADMCYALHSLFRVMWSGKW